MKAFETVGHRCIMSKCIGCELEKSTGRQNIKPGELPAALPLFCNRLLVGIDRKISCLHEDFSI